MEFFFEFSIELFLLLLYKDFNNKKSRTRYPLEIAFGFNELGSSRKFVRVEKRPCRVQPNHVP